MILDRQPLPDWRIVEEYCIEEEEAITRLVTKYAVEEGGTYTKGGLMLGVSRMGNASLQHQVQALPSVQQELKDIQAFIDVEINGPSFKDILKGITRKVMSPFQKSTP